MKKLKHSKLLFPEIRPNCPRCDSTHIQSRGMEWRCVDCRRAWAKMLSPKIREKLLINERNVSKRWRMKIRFQVLELLGNKCVKCGFTDYRALQIDHVHGGGTKQIVIALRSKHGYMGYLKGIIEEVKSGSKKYQLLCANCNSIKRIEKDENYYSWKKKRRS